MHCRPPSYRLHRPTGQAVVTLSGRDVYLGKHNTPGSRAEYDRLIAEWLANGRRPPGTSASASSTPGGAPTIDELILAYWRHVESYYLKDGRPTSEQDTIRQALRFLRRHYGGTPAGEFGPLALKVVRQAMIDHKVTRRVRAVDPATGEATIEDRVLRDGQARGYINKQVNRIRLMFAWAAENELLPVAVHQALMTVPGLRKGRSAAREKPPVAPAPEADVEAVLPHLPPTVAAMVRLQRLTGLRPQEVVLLRGDRIDRSDPGCWSYRPSRHKGEHRGRERVAFLGPRAQAVLAPFLEAAGDGYLFSPIRSEAGRNAGRSAARRSPMTPSQSARKPSTSPDRPKGEHYSAASYRRAGRRACMRLGIPIWFPHQLRHSAATSIRSAYGLEASQAVLGHSELGTTQVYAERDQGKAREIMRQVG